MNTEQTTLQDAGPKDNLGTAEPETQNRRYAAAQCCICKAAIKFEIDAEAKAINLEGFDPCVLVIVTSGFGPRDLQREQEFPCHIECFRKIVGDNDLYVTDSDYGTIGEGRREQEREAAEAAEQAMADEGLDAGRLDALLAEADKEYEAGQAK